jgi:hypothetical protein
MPGFPYGGVTPGGGVAGGGFDFLDYLRRLFPQGSGAGQLVGQPPMAGAGKAITDQIAPSSGIVTPRYPPVAPAATTAPFVAPRTVAPTQTAVPRTTPVAAAATGTNVTEPGPGGAGAFVQPPGMLAAPGMGPEGAGAPTPPIEAPGQTPDFLQALQAIKAASPPEQQRLGAPSTPELYRGRGGGLETLLTSLARGGNQGGIGPNDLLYLSKLLGR